jgi:hypothetical protein
MTFCLAIFTTIIISEICKFFYPKSLEEIMQIGEDQFNDFCSTMNHVFIVLGYNAIYYFSCCQIYVNKIKTLITYLYNTITNYTGSVNAQNLSQKFTIKICNNGNLLQEIVVHKLYDTHEEVNITDEFKNDYNYDLILMNDTNNNIKCLDKTYKLINFMYRISSVKFIAMEIWFNNNTYPICLKNENENENYYIVGNIFNKDFFKYYLTNNLAVPIYNDTFDYKISIIDHNANFIELLPNQVIIIGENDYEIK